MKVEQGKYFLRFKDEFGWITKINIRPNPIDIEIEQNNKIQGSERYAYLDEDMVKSILNKIDQIKEDAIQEQEVKNGR